MAMDNQILDKIKRNLEQISITIDADASTDTGTYSGYMGQGGRLCQLWKSSWIQSYGGTCHTDVFDRIEEEYLNPDNAKNKFIVLTFSDMYSNIEHLEQSGNYTWLNPNSGVSKYWVTTEKEITSVDGIHIHVDKGVIAWE